MLQTLVNNTLWKYILRKFLTLIPVLFGLTLLAFSLGVLAPGDPAELLLMANGMSDPTEREIQEMRGILGLDQPIYRQYLSWSARALKGDFGRSYMTSEPVLEAILRRLPVTLSVSLSAILVAVVWGISWGIIMAVFRNGLPDRLGQLLSLSLISMPGFWLAILLIYLFAETFQLLPTSGYGSLKHLVLPSIVLAAGSTGFTMRLTRAAILDELYKEYIMTAHAKGVHRALVIFKHAFCNSLIPVVTFLGTYFGNILGGSVIVEVIFALPGLGQFAINGVMGRDYPVIQGYVLLSGTIFVLVNLLIDMVYVMINPQIRLGAAAQ